MTQRQRLTLLGAILGSAVVTIDGSIVNVALPAIEQDLGGGLSAQQWVVNAYLLTLASLILIGGSLGDIYGERRVFELGLVAFGACSVACALAPNIELLIGARALQGAAGALVTPSSLAIIVAAFGPAERGAAIGSWTAWGGISAVVGPLAGGLIVDQVSWRWIFAVNVPLVLVTLPLIRSAVPRTTKVEGRRVDFVGAGLCALGLGGVVFALVEQPHYGWRSPVILVPLIAGVVVFASFLVYERRAPEPMLKLDLFTRRNFAVGNAETLAMYAGLGILFFYLVIFLQQVAGYTALESGLTTLPVTLMMFALSRRFGALADRYGPRLFMGAGPLIAASGILLLLRVGMEPSYVAELLPALLLFSLGLSLTVAPLVATVLADVDESDAGIASAINNAVARVAGLVGVSLVGVVVAGTLLGDTFAANDESVRAFHQVVLVCAALVAAGGIAGHHRHHQPETGGRGREMFGRPAVRCPGAGRRACSGFHGHNRTSPTSGGLMEDPQIHGTIEQLVAEEHELWDRESGGNASEADRQRLHELRVSLERRWDLLRQRRALRDAGRDPEAAAVGQAEVSRATSSSSARRTGGQRDAGIAVLRPDGVGAKRPDAVAGVSAHGDGRRRGLAGRGRRGACLGERRRVVV